MKGVFCNILTLLIFILKEEEQKKKEEKKEEEENEKQNTEDPLDKEVLDEFTDKLFPGRHFLKKKSLCTLERLISQRKRKK